MLWLKYCWQKVKAVHYVYANANDLVAKREWRMGPVNNNNGRANEPRLPLSLADYDTPDNSLWGDDGWKTKHSVALGLDYKEPEGMAAWLCRNPCYGLGWTKLGAPVNENTKFTVYGNTSIDNESGKTGILFIKSSEGYWELKVVFRWLWFSKGMQITLGWLLDSYVKDPELYKTEPKAIFQLEPRFVYIAK